MKLWEKNMENDVDDDEGDAEQTVASVSNIPLENKI